MDIYIYIIINIYTHTLDELNQAQCAVTEMMSNKGKHPQMCAGWICRACELQKISHDTDLHTYSQATSYVYLMKFPLISDGYPTFYPKTSKVPATPGHHFLFTL